MHVGSLELRGFRNYRFLSFRPDPGLNVLIGRNGQGKTSLLEAIHLLLAGRSFRTARLAECVELGGTEAVVAGEIEHEVERRAVRLRLLPRGGMLAGDGLCPWARVVTFAVGDVGLLDGPPAGRRSYVDGLAAKLAPAHGEACRRYRLVLAQRGRLLERLAGRGDGAGWLDPWDEQLAALGSEILHRRLEAMQVLGDLGGEVWRTVAPDAGALTLEYTPTVAPSAARAETEARLLAALVAGRRRDVLRRATLVGPHRDDVVVRLAGVDARVYASRGEQRLVALTLRLAEAAAVKRRLARAPILLLDDVLSELDAATRARTVGWLAGQGQVLLSAAERSLVPECRATTWQVDDGAVARGAAAVAARGSA